MKMFPATSSLLEAEIALCTSPSSMAAAGTARIVISTSATAIVVNILCLLMSFLLYGQRIGQECTDHTDEEPEAPCVHDKQHKLSA